MIDPSPMRLVEPSTTPTDSARRDARGPAPAGAWVLPLAFTLCLLPAPPGTRAEVIESPVQAGWIDSFDGPASGYVLTRSGGTVPVAYFLPLDAGDRIEVRTPGSRPRAPGSDPPPRPSSTSPDWPSAGA